MIVLVREGWRFGVYFIIVCVEFGIRSRICSFAFAFVFWGSTAAIIWIESAASAK